MPQALPLSLSVPISLVKAGTMPAWHRPPQLHSCLSTGHIWACWDSWPVTAETGNFPPFPSAWEKPRAGSGAAVHCQSAWDSCNSICWEEEGSYGAPEIQQMKHRVCVRSWTGAEGSALLQKAGHAVCSANLTPGLSGFLSLVPPRAGLSTHCTCQSTTRLWLQLVIQS